MTPERLKELQHQRALLQAHMDRLDQEIAGNTGIETAQSNTPGAFSADTSAIDPDLLNYEPDPVEAGQKAKRGCLIVFVSLMLVGALVSFLIYFLAYRDHPVIFAPVKESSNVMTTFSG